MFTQDREQIRRFFCEAWRKARDDEPLEPLERLVAEVAHAHPEYHGLLEQPARAVESEYTPEGGETNPFLHMGMHVAIQEQLQTDRPHGIRDAYQTLLRRLDDAHGVEHALMECLGEALWQAQRQGALPDETAYLECVRRLAGSS